ncbi:E3 ubiquitin-protein ligase RNF216-like [Rhopilema esculentum]|uniref:E3 ubiquitin-protein ligase RNF216-like n=1 Tax=Rhopilema esculentum TaxID=499914 RepID=UPI0031DA48A1
MAQRLNEHQYQQEGQYIECNCCFGEAVFEDMTQCSEGHLSCLECLRNYAKEAIYGSGKIPLCCLTSDCSSIFPLSQLEKALDSSMFDKYQERLQEESLKMAELPDLVRCPSCDYAAEMPAGDKVFKCQNTDCMKETCRYCKEPWQDHFGIPCTEMESGKEKNIRVSYEEKMSKAKIRTCSQCGCGFMKTDGCNKMTCRCGTTMCYICRISKIGYQHFCSHPRDPGKLCTMCKKCSLWTDPTEDDERAVRELKEEAAKEVAKVKTPTQNDVHVVSAGSKRPLMVGPPEEHNTPKKHKKRR